MTWTTKDDAAFQRYCCDLARDMSGEQRPQLWPWKLAAIAGAVGTVALSAVLWFHECGGCF